MRTRILLKIVVIAGLVGIPGVLLGQKETAVPTLSLRQQVDLEVMNLQKNVEISKNFGDRIKLIEKTVAHVRMTRQNNPKQLPADEIYLGRLSGSLEELPKSKDGKICTKTHDRIIHLYDPKSHGNTEDPALLKTLVILNAICS